MSNIRRVTLIILLFLFIGRILESFYLVWNQKEVSVPHWWEVSYLITAYLLISISIYLNRSDLGSLNIDKNFVLTFILIGVAYVLILPIALGIILGIFVFLDFMMFSNSMLKFEDYHLNYWQLLIFMLLYIAPDVLIIIITGKYPNLQNEATTITSIFVANPAGVVFEEVIYRGMLWSFLKQLNLKDGTIIVVQAILFWITHINDYSRPLEFWLLLPLTSIILGLLVWRSKSITFSTAVHFLHNLLIALPY